MLVGTAALALLGLIGSKFVDFSKYVKAGDKNGAFTQLYVWAVSIGITILFANSGLADTVVLPFSSEPLAKYSLAAQILIGLAPGSLGSFLVDYKKAADDTQSAAVPSLFE